MATCWIRPNKIWHVIKTRIDELTFITHCGQTIPLAKSGDTHNGYKLPDGHLCRNCKRSLDRQARFERAYREFLNG